MSVPVMAPPTMLVPTSLGLAKQVRHYFKTRPQRARSAGNHPSSVSKTDYCPVLSYYVNDADDDLTSTDPARIERGFAFKQAWLKTKKPKRAGTLRQEFVIGDAIHELVQFGLGVTGRLRGLWMCQWCRATTTAVDFMPRTQIPDDDGKPMLDAAPCRNCSGRNMRHDISWLYVEPGIAWTRIANELEMDGHMDGDLWEHREGYWYRYVLEIKSINEWGYCEGKNPQWEDLAVQSGWTPPADYRPALPSDRRILPNKEHITQATIYAACHGITHIVFIYVNKNQVSQWKEYVVPIDPAALTAAAGRIQAVQQARLNATGPPLHARVCYDVRDETARRCPAVERCFGCKADDGGFKW